MTLAFLMQIQLKDGGFSPFGMTNDGVCFSS